MPDPEVNRPWGGRIPVVVLVATLAFGALGSVWSVMAPLGEAPDEPAHLALVLHLADGHPYPDYDGLYNQVAIVRLCKTYASSTRACPNKGEKVTQTSMRRHPAADAPDKATRPAWDDDGGAANKGAINQMPQHPPLYYQAMATVLRAERWVGGGPWSTDRELALLRLVNVLLITPLPLLAWWAARRFGLDERLAVTASLAVFGVPMLTHLGSTVNNDNLLTLLCAVVVALLAGVVRGDQSTRTGVLVGVATGLALLTKAFAVVLPPLVLIAYLIGALSRRDAATSAGTALKRMVRPLLVAGGVTAVLSAWWYVGVRARTGRFAPTTESTSLSSALRPPGFQADRLEFTGTFLRNLDNRFWGAFGWYSIRFSTPVATVCFAVVAVTVGVALWPREGAAGSTRIQRAFLLLPMAALGAFVVLRAWSLYVETSKFQFIQGRYLFGGITAITVLVAIGAHRLAGRWATVVVAGAALVLQAEALRRCLQGWWGGPGLGPRGQVKAMVAWSAWPGELVAVMAVLAVATGLWLAWALWRWMAAGPSAAGTATP